MARAADALHPRRHRGRRLDLHDEIDGAHVDPELEGRGGDDRRQAPRLERILDGDALLARDRAVVGADQLLSRQVVQRRGQALG